MIDLTQTNASGQDAPKPGRGLPLAHSDLAATSATDASGRLSRQASSYPSDAIARPAAGAEPIVTHRHTDRVGRSVRREQPKHRLRGNLRHRHDDGAALLAAAVRGDQRAWSLLVRRHSPMIERIARRHRLNEADQQDVAQRTWVTLLRHARKLRDPAALDGWLATVARRECLRVLAASQRELLTDEPPHIDDLDSTALDETLAERERHAALHAALNSLPCHQRELMRSLLAKPTSTYDQLSATLGIPPGSIGPTRGRCLARLRRDPHLLRAVAS